MIYQLYEDGYVQSLDDPIIKYAPDFSIINPFSKLVFWKVFYLIDY